MKISAATFKAKCLKLMDQVARTHREIIVTKRGKPVVRILPAAEEPSAELFGLLKGTVTEIEDITRPLDVVWKAAEPDGNHGGRHER